MSSPPKLSVLNDGGGATPPKTQHDVELNPLEKKVEVVEIEIPELNGEEDTDPYTENKNETESNNEEEHYKIPIPSDGDYLDDKSTKLDVKTDDEGDDTATLPLKKKKHGSGEIKEKEKKKIPMYLFPITRLKFAWTRSQNVFDFTLRAIGIIFTTLGWFFCVGGVPLMSLIMLIMGSIFKNDCNIEPNIPVYLIVSGVFGTIQHVISIWTKYVPKDSQGLLKEYRTHCKSVDYLINLFNFIWFILGCVWVYGAFSQVDFIDSYKDEYCDKRVYLFAFWILNLSFILLAILIVGTLGCIICIATVGNKEDDE